MADDFNPYYAFLGLDEELDSPTPFQLLRLREGERDVAKIDAAVDKATTRVRNTPPGEHAKEWAKLLEEIQSARTVALYLAKQKLQEAPVSPTMSYAPAPSPGYAYPPGMEPHPQASVATNPMAPYTPGVATSPVAYSKPGAHLPPAGPAVAPPVPLPATSNAIDPMAPVTFPVQPANVNRVVGFAPASNPSIDPQAPFAASQVSLPAPVATTIPTATPSSDPVLSVAAGKAGRPLPRRRSNLPLLLLATIGASVLVVGGLLAVLMNQEEEEPLANNSANQTEVDNANNPSTPAVPAITPVKPAPVRPTPPAPQPIPEPKPEPQPEPVKPTPPEPKPEPKPEPMTPPPSPAELAEFAKAINEARVALGEFAFEEAAPALDRAEKAAKLPEQQAKVMRLRHVSGMAKQFRNAIKRSMASLKGGDVIKVGTSTEAAIVESSPDELIIRVAGKNQSYTLDTLPLGLAANLGDRSLAQDNPNNKAIKAAYVLLDKRTTAAQREKAKVWWEEAQASGVNLEPVLPFLDDTFEME